MGSCQPTTERGDEKDDEFVGECTTGRYGYITVPELEPGWYTVVELQAPNGYKLIESPINVELKLGDPTIAEFENTKLPELLIKKVDTATGLPLAGIEFEVTTLNGTKIGTFETDEYGLISLPAIDETTVVVRETKTLPGYKIDTTEKTVLLTPGEISIVEFSNSPWPYLVILKIDEETKKPLPDTMFKLMEPSGREMGTYKTNTEGKIILTGMDAGEYKLQETQAAVGYILDDRVWDISLAWGKTTTVTFKNTPLEIQVEVNKRGPVEAIAGQEIQYDFDDIANFSSVSLDEFYWHDLLPTDAVRLVSITTGTWNQDLMYKVIYRTNLKDNWTLLRDNLITSVNHTLDCSQQVLGLASNEFLTEFKFLFGTVQTGFQEVKSPIVVCRVLADLPLEYQFTNRTDVGGRYGDKWTYDKDSWTTVIFNTPEERGKLPKTGIWL